MTFLILVKTCNFIDITILVFLLFLLDFNYVGNTSLGLLFFILFFLVFFLFFSLQAYLEGSLASTA